MKIRWKSSWKLDENQPRNEMKNQSEKDMKDNLKIKWKSTWKPVKNQLEHEMSTWKWVKW